MIVRDNPHIVITCARCGAGCRRDGKCNNCGLQMPRNSVLPISAFSYPEQNSPNWSPKR